MSTGQPWAIASSTGGRTLVRRRVHEERRAAVEVRERRVVHAAQHLAFRAGQPVRAGLVAAAGADDHEPARGRIRRAARKYARCPAMSSGMRFRGSSSPTARMNGSRVRGAAASSSTPFGIVRSFATGTP